LRPQPPEGTITFDWEKNYEKFCVNSNRIVSIRVITEAFRAFHNFRRGEEDADDSFSLGSPVPRAISRNTSEVTVTEEA
jgi:hypothetical protein